jgi:hypothetical protein
MTTPRLTIKRATHWFGLAIVAVASIYFIQEVIRQLPAFGEINLGIEGIIGLMLSTALMVLVVVIGGIMWHWLLKDQQQATSLLTALRVVALSQMAKYLPGNVGHLIGQVTLAKAAGIPIGVALTTLTISTLWLIAIGLGLGSAGLLALMDEVSISWLPPLTPLHIAGLVFFLCLAPWVGIGLVNRLLPALSERLGGGQPLANPRLSTGLMLGAGFTLCFFLFGIMLQLQTGFIFQSDAGSWLTFTLLFTGAWVAGYLVPGAPGGLGVREAMMIVLLSPIVGVTTATGLGISMRIVTTAGDAVAFLLGTGLAHWEKRYAR